MGEANDKARFEAFYREHSTAVLAVSLRRLDNFASAEEATSEVFRVAWQRLPMHPSRAWLYVIARNVIGNACRRRRRARQLEQRLMQVVPDGGDQEPDFSLREAILQLNERDRALLFYYYGMGLDTLGTAAELKVTVPVAWVRLSRARQRLRILLTTPSDSSRGVSARFELP